MSDRRTLALLFAGALALRVVWVLAVQRHGFPVNDTFFYHETARSLAAGDGYVWFGEATSRWPPVYPFLLGAVYWLFGSDAVAGELLNALAGALAAPLAYVIALRLFGRREALVAGVLVAILPAQIFFTDVLMAETLYATLLLAVVAMCLFLPRERWWAALVVGLAVGVAAETRGEGLLLLTVPIAAWWRPSARQLAVLAAGVLLIVGPWTVRNFIQMDSFVPVSTNGAQTLWSGHNPGAYGGPSYSGPTARARPSSPKEEELQTAKRLRKEAIDYAVSHPLGELILIPRKFVWLLRGDSALIFQWVQPGKRGQPLAFEDSAGVPLGNLADLFGYALLAATFAAAFVGPRPPVLWAILGVSLVLYCVVLYGNYRYRLPLEPLMAVAAAPLLVGLWELRRRPRVPLSSPVDG